MLRRILNTLGSTRIAFEVVIVAAAITYALRPTPPPPPRHSKGELIYRLPVQQKLVALTFDDGPHPVFTPEIVDILDKHQAKATFFMVGKRMLRYPNVVKDVFDHGHTIANHTYSHPHNLESDAPAQIADELEKCERVIEKMTGTRTHLFRPPLGLVNGTVIRVANEEGYQVVLWTVSADHHDAPTPELMAKRVLQHVSEGAIILAHDGIYPMRHKDVKATSLIIDELGKRGYTFVTVPELIGTLQMSRQHTRPTSGQTASTRPRTGTATVTPEGQALLKCPEEGIPAISR